MIANAQDVLEKFGQLPVTEKKKVVSVILRQSLDIETPELTDEELILNAEEIFLELDRREAENGKS
jgi:hypothetical protein